MATSSRHAGPAAEGSRVVTVAKQIQRSPLPSASAEGIGRSYPLGATVVDGGVNFSLFSRTATGVELLFFDREDDASSVPRGPDRSSDEPHLPLLARVRARSAAGTDLRLPGRGAVGPREGSAVRSRQGPARPVRPGRGRSEELRPRGRETSGRQRGDGDEERGRRSERVRLGGRPPAEPALRAHHHLRDARPRIHAPPEFRGRREDPRHLRRPDREDSVSASNSASPPWSCCRCSSSTPRIARRAWSTTGAISRSPSSRRTRPTARARTRSARWMSSATWSRPCTGRASRSSSTWCSTTPPRAITPGRRSVSVGSTTRPTTSSKRAARGTPTTPAAATR